MGKKTSVTSEQHTCTGIPGWSELSTVWLSSGVGVSGFGLVTGSELEFAGTLCQQGNF